MRFFEIIGLTVVVSLFTAALVGTVLAAIAYFGIMPVCIVGGFLAWALIAIVSQPRITPTSTPVRSNWPINCNRNFDICKCDGCFATRRKIIEGGFYYNNGSPNPGNHALMVERFKEMEENRNV